MLQSSFLYLRPLKKTDLPLFIATYTDAEMMLNIGSAMSDKETSAMFYRILDQQNRETPNYLFYVIQKQQDALGLIGLLWNQKSPLSVELGIMISKKHHGKGYAYKAVKLLMQHTFEVLKMHSMVVCCGKKNTMANRISQALGFQQQESTQSQNNKIKWEITIEQFASKKNR